MALTRQGTPKRRHVSSSAVPGEAFHQELPTHQVPDRGVGLDAAAEKISSELLLDGQSRLNLATFVTTWMPVPATMLMASTADKNMIDKDEYPQTAQIEEHCVNMLGRLWECPYHLGPEEAAAACDENTIGVVAILGSTFDGSYEPVKEIAEALDNLESDKGVYVPIHVDAASGGFVAPFLQPHLEWDFRIERVQSINASGHKYGLVYPGVGWAVWRDEQALPRDLIFDVNYLGGHMPTFALNFSRPGSEVIAQYLMLTGLGRDGYTRVMQGAQDVAVQLSSEIAQMGPYELLSDGRQLPVFAFKLRDDVENYTVFDVSDKLREAGWLVPAYTFPENLQDMAVLRIVVRAGMTAEMADLLLEHMR